MGADLADFDILIDDNRWTGDCDDIETLALACRKAAAALDPRLAAGATLLLANDATLKDLNRRFRGKDKPTNVLSFPAGGDTTAFPVEGAILGDIAIAYETCRREADEQSLGFRDHLAHLIVHGLLHLVGYDHENDGDADHMERLETRILATLGVADPYAPADDGRVDAGENG